MKFSFLKSYQQQIEKKIDESLASMGIETPLKQACAYALKNGGKRFRPSLVFLIAKSINPNMDVSDAAFAVECFHTASLIADDLPCMDDEVMRREKPALHKVFGESTALLASYALIAEGYDRLASKAFPPHITFLAVKQASLSNGIFGATGGQYLDLYPPTLSEENVLHVLRLKTGMLFELSFVLGWLFGGGEESAIPLVKQTAHRFGLAFQLFDDLLDYEIDLAGDRKINFALVAGKEKTIALLDEEASFLTEELKGLGLLSPELLELLSYFEAYSAATSSSS